MRTIVLKKIPKITATIAFFLCTALLFCSVITAGQLPRSLSTQTGDPIPFSAPFPTVAKTQGQEATFNLFGCIPISTVSVAWEAPPQLVVGGMPFGVKLLSKGVLVVGITKVETATGHCCPGKEAGLELGDLILSVNNTSVTTNSQLHSFVTQTQGNPLTLTVERQGTLKTLTLQPALSGEGVYRIGIWVRDSTAGLGTLTFYHPASGLYGGLGHGVCDTDTGELISLSKGEIVKATVNGIRKGTAGTPGELKGALISGSPLGTIGINCNCGVFGVLTAPVTGTSFPLGYKQEVTKGKAQVYSAVSGTLQPYECQIEKITLSDRTQQNMIVTITDRALLSQTGGIVQGMSGSPIVQNGKLVGAVTHVFVNDPTKGYAVFAETMWQTAKQLEETATLQKAS